MTSLAPQLKRAVQHLRKNDPILKEVIKKVGPCEFKVRRKRFQTLVRSIISQQISVAAAQTVQRRLEKFLAPQPVSPELLAQIDLNQLREIGISRQKAIYLLDLAESVESGHVNLQRLGKLNNEEVIKALTQIKGIGAWTAQIFLMFSLGRLDVFPTGDLGIQKAIKINYNLRTVPDQNRMRKIGAIWAPFETIASWYLWKSLELPKPDESSTT